MRWIHTPLPASEVEAFGRQLGVSPVLAELLLRNGLREADAASRAAPALAARCFQRKLSLPLESGDAKIGSIDRG